MISGKEEIEQIMLYINYFSSHPDQQNLNPILQKQIIKKLLTQALLIDGNLKIKIKADKYNSCLGRHSFAEATSAGSDRNSQLSILNSESS